MTARLLGAAARAGGSGSVAAARSGDPFLPSRPRERGRGLKSRQALRRRRAGHEPATLPTTWAPAVLGCVALAAVSLLAPSQPTYDPWAWIIWGREIPEWDLVTTSGPSWKPLPVLFTTPFSLLGDGAAPALWLVVARTGGLLAIVAAYRLAARIAGPVAGVVAGVGLALSDQFVRHFARGNSEGILIALCLAAVGLHLEGRRTVPFLLGFAAALLRPEVWPFFGLYGLWLAWREPSRRLLVLGAFAATAILWFVPEYLGSGDFLRAAERARQANANSAAFAERPLLEVFRRAGGLLALPIWAGGVVALVYAAVAGRRKHRAGTVIALAVVAAVLMFGVGVMTEAGFAGNLRYVALPAALVCVLAGVGWSWLVRGVRDSFGATAAGVLAALLVALAAPFALESATSLRNSMTALSREAAAYEDLDRAIAASGGVAATERCGRVVTGPYEVQVLAWKLHRHGMEVGIDPRPPGTLFAPRHNKISRAPGFDPVAATERWVVRRACGS